MPSELHSIPTPDVAPVVVLSYRRCPVVVVVGVAITLLTRERQQKGTSELMWGKKESNDDSDTRC